MRNSIKQIIGKKTKLGNDVNMTIRKREGFNATDKKVEYKHQAPLIKYISNNEINDIKILERRISVSVKTDKHLPYKLIDGKMVKQF